jgi:predicted alpha/beta superfamily hydrolase
MNKKVALLFGILLIIIGFLTYKLFFVSEYKPYDKSKHQPFILSVVDSIPSKILKETRVVNVYLPEGYSDESEEKYPVIYLLDGGVEEDFVHITGLVRYNTQPWINRFPKSIVVGIENIDRKKDFTFSVPNLDFVDRIGFQKDQFPTYGGSSNYISFLEKELQPFIANKYKTNDRKTIIGESLGGLLATEILLKHRNLFSSYIVMSPSLWWGKESLLTEASNLLKAGNNNEVKVYIGAPNKKENQIMYMDAVALNGILKRDGGKKMSVYFDYLPDETHSTIIHQGVYNAFKLLNPKTEF